MCSSEDDMTNISSQSTLLDVLGSMKNKRKFPKDESVHRKKIATEKHNDKDPTSSTTAQPLTSPEELLASNMKDQIKNPISRKHNDKDPTSSTTAQPLTSPEELLASNMKDQIKNPISSHKEVTTSSEHTNPSENSSSKSFKLSNHEGNGNKPQALLVFKQEHMNEKRFLNDSPGTFDHGSDCQNSIANISSLQFELHTSWERCAYQKIENTAEKIIENLKNNNSTPITIDNFFHYAKVVAFLIGIWYKQPKHERQDIIFSVGRFLVRLQASDLYCIPIKKDEEEIHLNDRNLSYATLKLSPEFAKKYSETSFNYIMGNHDKVKSYVRTPQDAIAVCAILFSEVIRYPNMFFHNILLMQYLKSWNEFCDSHPMVRGGSWKCQREDVPEKVKKIEQENLGEKKMGDEGKRSTLFHLSWTNSG